MSNKTITFTMFVFGVAIGSVVTWQYVKKKYEQIAQEEIDSVKEIFSKRETENIDKREKANHAKEKEGIVAYAAKLKEYNYSQSDTEDKKEKEFVEAPYVIPPEEFGEFEDYEKISLTYYADEILTDDNDEVVDDVEYVVGSDALNSIGE